jgi:hypothetical protein
MMKSRTIGALSCALCLALTTATHAEAAQRPAEQIRIEYVPPKNPEHQPIYDEIKQVHVLERMQELLSPLRLPRPLLLKVTGSDGESNAARISP